MQIKIGDLCAVAAAALVAGAPNCLSQGGQIGIGYVAVSLCVAGASSATFLLMIEKTREKEKVQFADALLPVIPGLAALVGSNTLVDSNLFASAIAAFTGVVLFRILISLGQRVTCKLSSSGYSYLELATAPLLRFWAKQPIS